MSIDLLPPGGPSMRVMRPGFRTPDTLASDVDLHGLDAPPLRRPSVHTRTRESGHNNSMGCNDQGDVTAYDRTH
jgi:hypothetical protein